MFLACLRPAPLACAAAFSLMPTGCGIPSERRDQRQIFVEERSADSSPRVIPQDDDLVPTGDDDSDSEPPPEKLGFRGKVETISGFGEMKGWAYNGDDLNEILTIRYYIDDDLGAVFAEVLADKKHDDPMTPNGHGLSHKIEGRFCDGIEHKVFFHIVAGEALTAALKAPKSFTCFAPSAAGREFFDVEVRPRLQNECSSCHEIKYEALFYTLATPTPADGGTPEENTLIDRASGIAHDAGDFCAGFRFLSPCEDIKAWWTAEFAPLGP